MASAVTRLFSRIIPKRHTVFDRCLLTSNELSRPVDNYSYNQLRLASNYRAAVLKETGKPLVIEEVKAPKKIQSDQVRVKVKYCAVNATDIMTCDGEIETKLPFMPGFEVTGEILEAGSLAQKEGFDKGVPVIGLSKDNYGGFAEQCVISMKDVWIAPESGSSKKYVALTDSYATALLALGRRAHLKEKDTVLVTAAAGGLGLAAVDLASHVYRAKVIGVCSTADKSSLVRDKGAWSALVYDPKNLVHTVKDVTEGAGVKVVFDAVGGNVFESAIKVAAHEGTVIVAGFASRQIPQLLLSDLLQNSFSILGVSLDYYRKNDPEVYRDVVQDCIDMCEQGLVSPHISAVFPLADVTEAIDYMRQRKSSGKVVVEVDD